MPAAAAKGRDVRAAQESLVRLTTQKDHDDRLDTQHMARIAERIALRSQEHGREQNSLTAKRHDVEQRLDLRKQLLDCDRLRRCAIGIELELVELVEIQLQDESCCGLS